MVPIIHLALLPPTPHPKNEEKQESPSNSKTPYLSGVETTIAIFAALESKVLDFSSTLRNSLLQYALMAFLVRRLEKAGFGWDLAMDQQEKPKETTVCVFFSSLYQ